MNTTSRILGEANSASRDPWTALYYARTVIKGRWPEGEEAIAKNPISSYKYATEVIFSRFPEGEAAISKAPGYAVDYAINVIGGRWPEAEETLARTLKDTSGSEWGEEFTDRDAVNELVRTYIKAFPEVSKLEWVMKGWLDWLDL
jgi:hypothetical protein